MFITNNRLKSFNATRLFAFFLCKKNAKADLSKKYNYFKYIIEIAIILHHITMGKICIFCQNLSVDEPEKDGIALFHDDLEDDVRR